ncbi:hypothetical protein [Sphingopyxis sp. JAI128]|uniref:hypothetical protein n=1 Tax=Sphingopyxis sp. JAI128 TaxID=2723066 RepID=UPI00161D9B2C|nr:hypothetical protein [Sphingopyxis sp. JAI128]MBB6424922.1 hypothetical protein [Sphingopyxis sp. JAI128]
MPDTNDAVKDDEWTASPEARKAAARAFPWSDEMRAKILAGHLDSCDEVRAFSRFEKKIRLSMRLSMQAEIEKLDAVLTAAFGSRYRE